MRGSLRRHDVLVLVDPARCDLERDELKFCLLALKLGASRRDSNGSLGHPVASIDQIRCRSPVLRGVLAELREQRSASSLHRLLVLVDGVSDARMKAIVSEDARFPLAPRTPVQTSVVAGFAQRRSNAQRIEEKLVLPGRVLGLLSHEYPLAWRWAVTRTVAA